MQKTPTIPEMVAAQKDPGPIIMGFEDLGRRGNALFSLWTFAGGGQLEVEFPISPKAVKFSRMMKARLKNDKKALKAYGVLGETAVEDFLAARGC